jgi:dTDP-4-amino-4,6-dideoxygalactose transaminase
VLELVGGYSLFVLGDAARAMMSAVENESVLAGGTVVPASLAHFGYLQATLRIP